MCSDPYARLIRDSSHRLEELDNIGLSWFGREIDCTQNKTKTPPAGFDRSNIKIFDASNGVFVPERTVRSQRRGRPGIT